MPLRESGCLHADEASQRCFGNILGLGIGASELPSARCRGFSGICSESDVLQLGHVSVTEQAEWHLDWSVDVCLPLRGGVTW